VLQGADGKGANSSAAGGHNLSFWDLIINYCFLCGAVPYFRARKLLVRPARSLYENVYPTQFETSMQELATAALIHQSDVKKPRRYRTMVFGRNIKVLEYSRKYSGFKPRVIKVVCLDTSSPKRGKQKLIEAQWPTKEKLKAMAKATGTSLTPDGNAAMSDILTIPVHGINDKKRLLAIAHDIYEEIGRGEMGGMIETDDLASFGGDNQSPDLVRVRPGDTVEVLPDVRQLESKLPLVHQYTDDQRRDFEAAVADMAKRLGDARLARAVVATSRSWELQRFWRVSNVKLHWSDKGVSVAFDFQNYVEARSEIATDNVKPASAPVRAKVKR
jgi:hypothetical protein